MGLSIMRGITVCWVITMMATVTCCRAEDQPPPPKRIVCTFLPVYVFTLNVVGDAPGVQVELLVSADLGCPHHYTVRPADMKALERADVVVANGLGMEPFLDEWLKSSPKAKTVTISDDCGVITEECGEGKHKHGDHDHGHVNGHVWTSPTEAIKQVKTLARKLGELDGERAETYLSNADAYVSRLEALRQKFAKEAAGFQNRRIVTTHDAFEYMARDLNLEIVAHLESEPDATPSAREMTSIIDAIKRTKAAAVFYEPTSPVRVAETIARDAGVPVYRLNPFNSLSGKATARSYEEVMEENLTILRKALGSSP